MGKSRGDVERKVKWDQDLKRRNALLGPFVCPWCFKDKSIQWGHKKENQIQDPTTGAFTIKHTITIFCIMCRNKKTTITYGTSPNTILDQYCKVFDEVTQGDVSKVRIKDKYLYNMR